MVLRRVLRALTTSVVAGGVLGASLIAAPSASADSSTTLIAGQSLTPSMSLSAGSYVLIMQTDGNLVEYREGSPVWSTGTGGHPGAHLLLQSDGNAVVYDPSFVPLWASHTDGAGSGASFTLQDDGNIVLYAAATARWYSGVPSAFPSTLLPGQVLPSDHVLDSPSGEFKFQSYGGSMAIQERIGAGAQMYEAITWNAGTSFNQSGGVLIMQSDGNLVLYASPGVVAWQSHTANSGSGNRLVMQDDGNLVIYAADGHAVWSANTSRAVLNPGQVLASGAVMRDWEDDTLPPTSLSMQTDGNLVLTYGSKVRWSSRTSVPGSRAVFQADGNFVVYSPSNQPLWNSGTSGHSGFVYLMLGGVGDLQLDSATSTYWSVG